MAEGNDRHPIGKPSAGAGLELWHELLATIARLAALWCVESSARSDVAPNAGLRPDSLGTRQHRVRQRATPPSKATAPAQTPQIVANPAANITSSSISAACRWRPWSRPPMGMTARCCSPWFWRCCRSVAWLDARVGAPTNPCRQGLRRLLPSLLAAQARHDPAHRQAWHRVQFAPWQAPMGYRAVLLDVLRGIPPKRGLKELDHIC